VLAGIALRFDGLERRPLWYDEAATVLHLSGRSEDMLRSWYDGRPLARADVFGASGSVGAAVEAARRDEPQSGPVYFAVAAAWQRMTGESLGALRMLSALASVVALAAAYACARRLFKAVDVEADVALAVAALVALSPLHVRYAQEARPYALWSLAVLLWMLVTLRAEASGDRRGRWPAAAVLLLALLVHPLTLLALPAVARLDPGRRFWIASGTAVGAWATLTLGFWWWERPVMEQTTAWVGEPTRVGVLARAWIGTLTSVLYRPGGEGGLLGMMGSEPLTTGIWLVLGVAAAALVVAALVGLTDVAKSVRSFVRRLAIVPWAAFAVLDVLVGGRRSTVARYLAPSWLGIELAAGHWLAARALPARRARRLVLVVVLLLSAITALRTRTAAFWWDTDPARMRQLGAVVAAIAARERPVVLTDVAPTALVELAYPLRDDVELRLGPDAPSVVPADAWDRVLVVLPSERLLAEARRALPPAHVLTVA
jgi:uncharacterized membrane protein